MLLLVRSPVAFPPLALTSNSVTFCGVVTPVPPVLVDTLPRLARPFAILRQTCDERVRGDQTLRTLALVVLAYATLLVAAWGVCSLLWSITLKAQVGTTLDSQEYVRAVTRRHWWGQQADPKPKGAFFLQKMIGRGMFVEYVLPSCAPSCVFCGTFPAALSLCALPVCASPVRDCMCALPVCACVTNRSRILVGMRDFTCPLLSMIMLDPVTACDGCTYERAAIEIWFERKYVPRAKK